MEFNKFQAQVDGGSVYSARDELRNIEQFLANYNRWIALKILEKKNNLLHILDFGAGIGTLAKQIYLIENIRPVCVEIDEYFKSELEELGYQTLSSTNEADLKFDLIYSSNVLEHIRDDESVLRELNGLLTDTGELVLYLPAFQILIAIWIGMLAIFGVTVEKVFLQNFKKMAMKSEKLSIVIVWVF